MSQKEERERKREREREREREKEGEREKVGGDRRNRGRETEWQPKGRSIQRFKNVANGTNPETDPQSLHMNGFKIWPGPGRNPGIWVIGHT